MITFYGHFTGWSSYPVVCRHIVEQLTLAGIKFKVCNLRSDGTYETLDAAQPIALNYEPVPQALREEIWQSANMRAKQPWDAMSPLSKRDGIGLVFGFPEWAATVPRHEIMIGYHVCDFNDLPEHWSVIMNTHCDRVLTPSTWCQDVFRSAGVDTPIDVVQHGVDFRVFEYEPKDIETPLSLVHFCSAQEPRRKGTSTLLRLFEQDTNAERRLTIRTSSEAVQRWVRASPARDRIHIDTGDPLPPLELAAYLRKFDAVMCPSLAEGFGMIPLEASALGVLGFISNATGHREHVDDTHVGNSMHSATALKFTALSRVLEWAKAARLPKRWAWAERLQPLVKLLSTLS